MSDISERLLALQAIDTERDQLAKRRTTLPEHAAATQCRDEVEAWELRTVKLQTRLAELESAIESAEQQGAAARADKQRLEGQLKTVIVPREAEALMHEIETLTGRQDELDLAEIENLEEQSAIDDELVAHLAREEVVRGALSEAAEVLREVLTQIDHEAASLSERADSARNEIPAVELARYDRLRANDGVAVARLDGKRCNGCHLDLSAAEVDDVKAAAGITGMTDCPHCGRMLVV